MADQPTPAPQGDAAAAVPAGATPAAFAPYSAFTYGNPAGVGVPPLAGSLGFPSVGIAGAESATTTKSGGAAVANPMAVNVFDQPVAKSGSEAPAAAPELARTALDTSTTKTTDAGIEISKPTATFVTDKDKSQAHLTIDEKGNHAWSKEPTAADKEVKIHVDSKFAGAKDDKKISAIIDKANAELRTKGLNIEVQKPNDMATALKNVQEQQAKAAKENKNGKTGGDSANKDKKPVPDGGGGGGGGGGGCAPDKKDRNTTNRDRNKDTNRDKSDSGKLPESYEKASGLLDKENAFNKGSYSNFTESVYGSIPGWSDMQSSFAAIDDDPNLSPEEKAAKKADLMKNFQEKNKDQIEKNTKEYGKELSDFGDKDSAASFDNIAKNLSDSSKAGDIVNMLSKKDNASSTDVNAVFDSKSQHAVQNLALVESSATANWKSTAKDKAEREQNAEAQAKVIGNLTREAFKFHRR